MAERTLRKGFGWNFSPKSQTGTIDCLNKLWRISGNCIYLYHEDGNTWYVGKFQALVRYRGKIVAHCKHHYGANIYLEIDPLKICDHFCKI